MTEYGLFASALILGLAGSLHCAAMCGPIYLTVSGFYEKPIQYMIPLLWQLIGKITGYALLGILFGIVGKGLSILVFQNTLMVISGLLLLLIGLSEIFRFKSFAVLENTVNKVMGRMIAQRAKGAFLLGVLNGFIPCGLVYAACVGAMAAGKPENGAIYMVLFGVGTTPVLVISAFSRWLIPIRKMVLGAIWKQIPVLLLGLLFLLKGMGVGIPYFSPDLKSESNKKNCCAPQSTSKPSHVLSP